MNFELMLVYLAVSSLLVVVIPIKRIQTFLAPLQWRLTLVKKDLLQPF